MATVSQIAQDLLAKCDGKLCLSQRDIIKATGYNEKRVQRIVSKLPPLGENTGKRFYYTDVAEAIQKDGKVDFSQTRKRQGRPRLLEA